jgi:hypothetical protein
MPLTTRIAKNTWHPETTADRNSQIPNWVSWPPHKKQHRTVGTHKEMQKTRWRKKKSAGAESKSKNMKNSKFRDNIKINTRKYGYVHVIDLHKQMSKGGGRRGGWGGGQEMQTCGRLRNRTEQKLERAKAHQCTLEKIPSCIWILKGRQS